MGFCVNCGAKLLDGAKFCQCCGTKVATQAIDNAVETEKPVSDGEVFVFDAQEYVPPVQAVKYEELPAEKKSSLVTPIIALVSTVLFFAGLLIPDSSPILVLFLPLMLIFGIIGLIKSIKGRRALGIVFSAVALAGTVLAILSLIVYLVSQPRDAYDLMLIFKFFK